MANVRISDEEVFVIGSTYPRHRLKARIIQHQLLDHKCQDCGLGCEWNNKKISLHLDHINGISNDNRIENLQFLCPNCHSQTETYAGKNSKGFRGKDKLPKSNYKKEKALKDRELWLKIRADSSLRIGEWGWKTRVGDAIQISAQNVQKWILRVDPIFLKENKLW